MPELRKSRQTPSTNGMPKSKIKKKGCRNREKSSPPKHKRHAKKQNQEKRMPEPGKSRQTSSANGMPKSKIKKKGCRNWGKAVNPQAQTACQKAKLKKRDARAGKKSSTPKHKRHAKINKIINNMLRYK